MTYVQGYSLWHRLQQQIMGDDSNSHEQGIKLGGFSQFPMKYYCGYETNEKALYALP